jgi:putative sterol carrier protein
MNQKTAGFHLAAVLMIAALSLGSAKAKPQSQNSTPQDVFDGMRQSFRAEKAKGVHALYQWELSGPAGGQWWIEVNDGTFKMGQGKIDNPGVTLIASDKTWVALSNGTLGGTWAFLTGRLRIRGDRDLAKKLGEIFP